MESFSINGFEKITFANIPAARDGAKSSATPEQHVMCMGEDIWNFGKL
jgi:hypothetical protein